MVITLPQFSLTPLTMDSKKKKERKKRLIIKKQGIEFTPPEYTTCHEMNGKALHCIISCPVLLMALYVCIFFLAFP